MRKIITIFIIFISAVSIAFVLGPRVTFDPIASPDITTIQMTLVEVDNYVKNKELGIKNLKPDNESRIIWADSIQKTPYSLVYLHGFSASPMESNPVHLEFARRYGMNLYLPLLTGHGLDDENSFKELTPNQLIEDAKEAIAIGQLLGDRVMVMACSTGGTLAVYLAGANREMIEGLIMYSPNMALYDETAKLITGPWGASILEAVAGTHRDSDDEDGPPESRQYWTTKYRNEGLIALQSLLDQTMNEEVFALIDQPYFIGYYYKNEEEHDKTISISAIKEFDNNTVAPTDQKRVVAFPEAGAHVITNPVKSKSVEAVRNATFDFAEEILGLSPAMKKDVNSLTGLKKDMVLQE